MKRTRQLLKYLIVDYVFINLAWLMFNLVRYFMTPQLYEELSFGQYYLYPMVLTGQAIFPLMILALYWLLGYYDNVMSKSRLDDLIQTASVSFISTMLIYFIAIINDSIEDRFQNYELLLILWTLLFVLTYIPRAIITARGARRLRSGAFHYDTIVIGKVSRLKGDGHRWMSRRGYKAVVELGWDATDEKIADAVERYKPTSFMLLPNGIEPERVSEMVNRLFPYDLGIILMADASYLVTSKPRVRTIVGEPLIDVSRPSTPPMTVKIKRIADIIVSALALIVLSPLFAVIAIAIKRDSSGPVFYSQERLGYRRRPFKIYKFRSMHTDAECDGPALSSDGDSRITKVGRVLRKYRLDELPQFWNVLRGDMSLVGPRPEREHFARQLLARAPYYSLIYHVRPGITSWGMVKYGYASDVDQMMERMVYDLIYVENVSFTIDIKVLFYTVTTVITGKGI